MSTIWRIRVAMRNQEHDWPDYVLKTLYQCYYQPDQDSMLPYPGWSIDSHSQFC
jgi:hypothetical protein